MGQVLHTLAFDYDGDLSGFKKRKEGMQELTYPEFTAFAQECFGKENVNVLLFVLKELYPKKVRSPINP